MCRVRESGVVSCRERCEGGRQGVVREEAGGSGVGAVVAVRVRMVPVESFCAVWQKEPL